MLVDRLPVQNDRLIHRRTMSYNWRFSQSVVERNGTWYGFSIDERSIVSLKLKEDDKSNPDGKDFKTIVSSSEGIHIDMIDESEVGEVHYCIHMPRSVTGGMPQVLYCRQYQLYTEKRILQLMRKDNNISVDLLPGVVTSGANIEELCEICEAKWHRTQPNVLIISYVYKEEQTTKVGFALVDVTKEQPNVRQIKTEFTDTFGHFSSAANGDILIPNSGAITHVTLANDSMDNIICKNVPIFKQDELIRHVSVHKGVTYIASDKGLYASTDLTKVIMSTTPVAEIKMKKIAPLVDVCGIIDQFVITTGCVYELDEFRIWTVYKDTICALIRQDRGAPMMMTLEGKLVEQTRETKAENPITKRVNAIAAKTRELQERKIALQRREMDILRRETELKTCIEKLKTLRESIPTEILKDLTDLLKVK